jgi:CHAD domain-containing protein
MPGEIPTAIDHAELLFRRTVHHVGDARGGVPRGWHEAVRAFGRLAFRLHARALDALVLDGTLYLALDVASAALPDLHNRQVAALARIARLRVHVARGPWLAQPRIDGDVAARVALAHAARWQLARVASLEHDVVHDRDVEAVHQLRVALRRMRCLARAAASRENTPWSDVLVAYVRSLGAVAAPVRDLDVTLDLLARVDAPVSCRAVIAERLRARRVAAQATLRDLLVGEAHRTMREALRTALDVGGGPRGSARAASRRHMARELKGLTRALHGDLQHDEGFHEVRKRARRVRDAAEVLGGALKKRERVWRRGLRPLQAQLGSLNDAAIMRMFAAGDDEASRVLRETLDRRRVTLLAELAAPLALLAGTLERLNDDG